LEVLRVKSIISAGAEMVIYGENNSSCEQLCLG